MAFHAVGPNVPHQHSIYIGFVLYMIVVWSLRYIWEVFCMVVYAGGYGTLLLLSSQVRGKMNSRER